MSAELYFTKENLDRCLRMLAKEFRKLGGGRMPAEIILIGGASVLINYGFRDMTYDVDAVIRASSAMKDAINRTGDALGLPNGWLNSDFTRTRSYSPKLAEYSVHYRTYSNILDVRTVSGEYLVAMKLMSGRQYKNDLSDIVGILWEHEKRGVPISVRQVDAAVQNLYGGWEQLPADARPMLERIMSEGKLESLYALYRQQEKESKEALVDFEKDYPGVTREDNIGDILKSLREKRKNKTE